ncbi:neuromedin-U receptor 2-like isoform X1 [Tribolium castaneum]|uniref:Neuropeptides capa receptor-like Protein n=1 Tax=Tribolium castaneum TaxID=7070 RepID=D6X3X9_TRICA|nr:neuromedin-U receptor 2-like [Tribolium castaneum]XP_015839430.1 PREDICTED: neuromedin-U receptor 2-like isoform X1 [Tribolium castaneum]XP_015839431.1 PREDICTED: neuromedin-U receptor 2-like isoform X1 [Tribolium castaneum]XP_015839432.1 PREDICTED: neuromedin-U receptor 2-like isoform X1 [Tribolium castaneum]XP_968501.2 PREDICTED: neuromedin-U receptor 2-like isoform X1 [Tribolium castaneum]AIZ00520.1 pyrokinin 1 receptor C [Tribolium castaneum]EEZ97728.2 Neuropeptides capa receptor-like |eukprot:NP_001290187.1 neuromedin-U receptor 2-like [Tribolium castaneum]
MSHLWNDTFNLTGVKINVTIRDDASLYPLGLVIPVTVVYGVIFVTGVIGNVSTCVVISCNKSMHTATNYYLFSLAISDMLLLISGLPPEMYRLWSPELYVFGEVFCILQGFAAETSANATVLTITAFTVERYVAICHPFVSHTMSKLSRAIRHIIVIWVVALCLAAPQAIQFGVEYEVKDGVQNSHCTVVSNFFQHAFEISTFVFFVGPMTLITVLYILIGIQLRKPRLAAMKKGSMESSGSNEQARNRNQAAQKRVVNMLIAVVVAFFICWAPFHAQRLMAVYLSTASKEAQEMTFELYMVLMHASGILYFLSTTINPVLYHIMSNKFREAFKKTLSDFWRRDGARPSQTYLVLSRCPPLNRQASDSVDSHTKEELHLKSGLSHRPYNFLGCNKIKQDSSTISECKTLQSTVSSESKPAQRSDKFRILRVLGPQKRPVKFFRQESVDSGHTISNSSLQDVEEREHSSSDLVKYMEEINEDIT